MQTTPASAVFSLIVLKAYDSCLPYWVSSCQDHFSMKRLLRNIIMCQSVSGSEEWIFFNEAELSF